MHLASMIILTRRYTTKMVKLQGVEPRLHWSPAGGAGHSTPQPQMHAAHSGGRQAAAAAPKFLAYKSSAPVTLVQPDIAQVTPQLLKTPVPVVVMWTPPERPIDKIVPRPPQPKTTANVRPSLAMPNHEIQVSSLELSSTAFVSDVDSRSRQHDVTYYCSRQCKRRSFRRPHPNLLPSRLPRPYYQFLTSSPRKGVVALPPANQTAAANGADSFMPGRPDSSSETGNGTNCRQAGWNWDRRRLRGSVWGRRSVCRGQRSWQVATELRQDQIQDLRLGFPLATAHLSLALLCPETATST